MIHRRLAVALVAATSTTLALLTPVQAEEGTGGSSDSTSAVSSLSSTDGTTEPEEDPEGLPEWGKSLEVSDETALAFEIIKAIMAVGLAVTQGLAIALPFIPGGADQVRNFFAQFGIRV